MKLTHFEIKRTASYETPANTLQAVATLTGPTGLQSLVLPTHAIVGILKIIETEAILVAQQNAAMVSGALKDAGAEILLTAPEATLALDV